MHIQIVHNKIYNMHLENRYSEFSFHTRLKRNNKHLCNQRLMSCSFWEGFFFGKLDHGQVGEELS